MKNAKNKFAGTLVKGEDGLPLVVFRGERAVGGSTGFHTRLPSISFGSFEAAKIYSETDTQSGDGSYEPKILACHLNIQKPMFNRRDCFIDFPEIVEAVGFDLALKLAIRYEDYAMNTDNWCSNLNRNDLYKGVAQLYAAEPEQIYELYTNIFTILDDPEFVAAAIANGFDGAIYNGTGANLLEEEYRIFDPKQAFCANTGMCYGGPIVRERHVEESGLSL